MVYLGGKSFYYKGVTLLPDYSDPLQWYFMPLNPHFSKQDDSLALSFLKFRGDAGNGGFLDLDCDLGIDQKTLDDVSANLQAQMNLNDQPRLAPLPLIDGIVKVVLLGQQSPDPTNTGPGHGTGPGGGGPGATATIPATTLPKFVVKIEQAAKPSLYGDNNAVFSVELDQYGATVVDDALRGNRTPMTFIGIVYSLQYVALRPAFNVRVHADWNRVQHHLDETFGVDSIFLKSQIEKTVDELIDQRAIQLDAELDVPDTSDNADVVSGFEQAKAEVREMITSAFFTPSLDPQKAEKDGWDKAAAAANAVSRLAVTGGWSSLFSFTYNKVDYTRIDKKLLNFDITERTAVIRAINPQGHLFAQGDLSSYIKLVDLSDPWFQRRTVNVIPRVNFDDDQVASVHVGLQYGDQPQDVILDGTAPKQLQWGSNVVGGAMVREATYDYDVTFKNADTTQRPATLSTAGQPRIGARTTRLDNLEIVPHADLYSVVDVPIYAVGFPWDRYPHVEVAVEYDDANNSIALRNNWMLDKSTPVPIHWKMFVQDRTKMTFRYRLTYYAADSTQLQSPWTETDLEMLPVADPNPSRWQVTFVPDFGDWSKVDRAFADVSYTDSQNPTLDQAVSYEFSNKQSDSKTFTVQLQAPMQLKVGYHISVVFKDGHVVDIPDSSTMAHRVIMRPDMKGHRLITVQTDGGSFDDKQLDSIDVDIRYQDPRSAISAEDIWTLHNASQKQYFEFDYVDTGHAAYQYKVNYHYSNGMSQPADWTSSEDDVLVLPVV